MNQGILNRSRLWANITDVNNGEEKSANLTKPFPQRWMKMMTDDDNGNVSKVISIECSTHDN